MFGASCKRVGYGKGLTIAANLEVVDSTVQVSVREMKPQRPVTEAILLLHRPRFFISLHDKGYSIRFRPIKADNRPSPIQPRH
jgi:hypothetical protein